MSQKERILAFLYDWTTNKMIPHVKSGMLEDLDAFIADILSEQETQRAVANMSARNAAQIDMVEIKKAEARKGEIEGEDNA